MSAGQGTQKYAEVAVLGSKTNVIKPMSTRCRNYEVKGATRRKLGILYTFYSIHSNKLLSKTHPDITLTS